jgi:uncharacterized protein DUF2470
VDTRTHTPVRPNWAERARTVLAAAASASVLWDGGRVDLLGCHHDDPLGDVILTLESTSTLVRSARRAVGEDPAVTLQLTELCAVSARERVRARVSLTGRLSELANPSLDRGLDPTLTSGLRPALVQARSERFAQLLINVTSVTIDETSTADDAGTVEVPIEHYRRGEPDPLYSGAAEQLQHLAARHPDAISLLTRLFDRQALIGVVRVLPIALDRYGLVLRVERLHDHCDVRLPFTHRIDTGAEAAAEIRHLLDKATRRRPCGR